MSEGQNQGLPSEKPGKAELLERIQASRRELEETIKNLDENHLLRPGAEGWSVKDHLAHVAVWERGMAALLRRQPRMEAMGVDQNAAKRMSPDELNEQIHGQHAGLSLEQALDLFHNTHSQMMEILDSLSEGDYYLPYAAYVPDGSDSRTDPVINWIVGNTFEHYDEHLGYIRSIAAE
jgi:uncharacterized protein (TIGR03083 family)